MDKAAEAVMTVHIAGVREAHRLQRRTGRTLGEALVRPRSMVMVDELDERGRRPVRLAAANQGFAEVTQPV